MVLSGETWVEEASNTQRTPYLFTAKELDEETGLYYFGARYYDPRTSVWQSPDPILASYMEGSRSGDGVYSPANLNLLGYSQNHPINLKDADGNEVGRFDWERTLAMGGTGAALGATTGGTAGLACGPGAPACSTAGGGIGWAGGGLLGLASGLVLDAGEEAVYYGAQAASWGATQIGSLWNAMTGSQSQAQPEVRARDLLAPPPGRIPLFRAVDPIEGAQLLANGGVVQPSPFESEGKYFALTPEGAAIEGRAIHGTAGFAVVATTAPATVLRNGSYFEDSTGEGRVPSIVVPNPELPTLTLAIPLILE